MGLEEVVQLEAHARTNVWRLNIIFGISRFFDCLTHLYASENQRSTPLFTANSIVDCIASPLITISTIFIRNNEAKRNKTTKRSGTRARNERKYVL